jgi:Tol biopolymer transport system component
MKRYLNSLWILVPVIALALSSCSKSGNELVGPEGPTILKKGGGGKPPKDPPPPADPAIAYTNGDELMVMNADGSNQTEVYSSSDMAGHPTWSPDGTSIAFLIDVSGTLDRELWRIDVTFVDSVPQGSNAYMLSDKSYWNPAWSPAGDVIAFPKRIYDPSVGNDTPREIRTIPAAGGVETTLYTAPEGHRVLNPTWKSDAAQIAFREQDTNTSEYFIKVYDFNTSTTTTVFGPVDYTIISLDWARTKYVFAFNTHEIDPSGLSAIYTLDLTEATPTPQFVIGGESRAPSWSPDDSKLVFGKPDRVRNGRVSGWKVTTYEFTSGDTEKLAGGLVPDWRRCEPCP